MIDVNTLAEKFKECNDARSCYVDILDECFRAFHEDCRHWTDINVRQLSRIKCFNLVYGEPESKTDISTDSANIICYDNILKPNCFAGNLDSEIVGARQFIDNYKKIIGIAAPHSIKEINENKLNLLANLDVIINYAGFVYHNFLSFERMNKDDYKPFIVRASIFSSFIDIVKTIAKTIIEILEKYTDFNKPVDFQSMDVKPGIFAFNEIPNDIATTRKEETDNDSEGIPK